MALDIETILQKTDATEEMYYRLVLIVAPSGAGKTDALKQVCECRGWPYLNVNLELSKRMLDMTARQRSLHASTVLHDLVKEAVRVGFRLCWQKQDYRTIITVAKRIPEDVLQEDPKLLMWYDQALTRLGEE